MSERFCYVYYRVERGQADALLAAIAAMRALLAPAAFELQRRQDEDGTGDPTGVMTGDGPGDDRADARQTWMEIHRLADGVASLPAIATAARRAGVAALALDGRHVEVFVRCA